MKCLFKFSKIPSGSVVVDTTSNTHPIYKKLSPFVLPAPPAHNFENLWQFSKVYSSQVDDKGNPKPEWFWWRRDGFYDEIAHRYPMGKGAIPLYSIYPQSAFNLTEKLGYIQARKQIYAPIYAENVASTDSYKILREQYGECNLHNKEIILLDYDAYDHQALGMSLTDVINNPKRKMGHSFVLMMMLSGELEKCICT